MTAQRQKDIDSRGGDVIFITGRGAGGAKHGDFIFKVPTRNGGEREVLRICGNGDFLVNGKKVTKDRGVYYAFREFLSPSDVESCVR